MFDVRTYRPAGPVMKAFHESDRFHRLLSGPIGSSKTTGAAVAEPFFTAMMQKPYPDGVRRAKVGVLRDTYRNLYSTLIPTWFQWVPRELGRFVGSDDRPATHDLSFDSPVGPCELAVEFRALGSNQVEAVCRGWELHGAYLDEEDLMPPEARPFLAGRVQRGGRVEFRVSRGVWGAFNKPDVDHPLFDICTELPEGYGFFDQPGGLLPGGPPYVTNPDAENLQNLSPNYYVQSAQGQPEWYIRRMIRNLWGASISGLPIFPEFDPDRHVAKVELEPPPGTELTLGADGGGTPAAAIIGRTPGGRRIVYGEVVISDPTDPKGRRLAHGIGPKRFAEAICDVLSQPRFARCRVGMLYGDPAAFYGADREAGEYAWMETLGQRAGLPVTAAPSNEIDLRLEAVRVPMTRLNHFDGQPDLTINPSCRWIRRGMSADYKYEQADPKQPGKKLKPQKSATSHVMDALQYALLGDQGRVGVTGGQAFDRHQPKSEGGVLLPASYRHAQAERAATGPGSSYGGGGGPSYSTGFDIWRS